MARKPRTEKELLQAVDHDAPPPENFSLAETLEEEDAPAPVAEEPVVEVKKEVKEKIKEEKSSVNYKWEIGHLDCAVVEDGLKDVVKVVHWRFSGTDGLHTVDMQGVHPLEPVVNKKDFIPYDDLKEEIILKWIMASKIYDLDGMKAQIARDLELLSKPPVVTKTAPWA